MVTFVVFVGLVLRCCGEEVRGLVNVMHALNAE